MEVDAFEQVAAGLSIVDPICKTKNQPSRTPFLPSYSPNLNRIERLWGFAKRQSVYGKYHADFASFRAAIEATLAGIPTTHSDRLKSLMTLQFQTFEDVSLLAG